MTRLPPPDRWSPATSEAGEEAVSGDMVSVVEIGSQEDILMARQVSRSTAVEMGFGTVDQTPLATAVSELARNTLSYAGGGRCRIFTRLSALDRVVLIEIEDNGPGIHDVADAMVPGYSTGGGLGLGLAAVHKLMDGMTIDTRPGLTRIRTWMTRRR